MIAFLGGVVYGICLAALFMAAWRRDTELTRHSRQGN